MLEGNFLFNQSVSLEFVLTNANTSTAKFPLGRLEFFKYTTEFIWVTNKNRSDENNHL